MRPLSACASKGQVVQLEGEIRSMRIETARRDSARAAALAAVITLQQRILDSVAAGREALHNFDVRIQSDLTDLQRQLLQVQELTGQSQQRLSELRTQLEARGEQIATTTSSDTTRPGAASAASADQMYEASLAQLRRGSTSTARLGLREMLRLYPTSERAGDALYFIGQSFAAENPLGD